MKKQNLPEKEKPPHRSRNGKVRALLGPVRNLEEHVRPDWWRGLFNSLYLKTDADVVDDREITRTEVEFFCNILDLKPEQAILDLCCGQGRHCLEMARIGYRAVEGLDRSHYLIQRAKTQARTDSLPVRFREGDARKLPYPNDSFDAVVILGNSFGYFETRQDDLRVLKEVFRAAKPGGKLLVDVTDGGFIRANYAPRSWEWIDKKLFVCRERSLSADNERLISREVITHVEKGVIVDQFYAERLYTVDELQELLEAAGFTGFKVHGELVPASLRNQDLGMMQQRIVATAEVSKTWTKRRKSVKSAERTVVVLLGDPTRADHVKPDAVFDEDDYHTIDELKRALLQQEGYRFIYLDHHTALHSELKRLSGRFDYALNLCDEGFDNNPRFELHIPAMLEQYGVLYTGAGPQCLAFCYDKSLVRGVAKEMEIPTPKAAFVKPKDNLYELPFDFPAIVKPNFGDSSFGITQKSVCYSYEDLVNAVSQIREQLGYDKPVLVEEFLPGKDISVGIIGNPPESYQALPVIEEDYALLPEGLPRICGYEAKWLPNSSYSALRSITAEIPEDTRRTIVGWCIELFERLECRDYARFDWRLDADGNPKLLEVNPNPGWCWDGHLAKMFQAGGGDYAGMLGAILRAAEIRFNLSAAEEKRMQEADAIVKSA